MSSPTKDGLTTNKGCEGCYLEEDFLLKLEDESLRQQIQENEKLQHEWEEIITKKKENAEHQLQLDKEAASSILAEEATNDRKWREQLKKEEDEEYEFYLEFGCYPYQVFGSDSEYETD
ncbi:hypothetical protein CTI12_AA178450 [Artemisia annua]|uniref:Uncharacterized protein n=1 Tax=Artemisia annua TaxID=35608 RepID=A0A2U1P9B8_ARTAN|nr:hypothetical protein CTI12_AA178450 [Artemisia annua]